tara:strand:+ start:512 stop:673 length:162 start_codon:yes stop_codon:yes gene_type:complete
MNIDKRLEQLESISVEPEDPIAILVQVVEKQVDEIVVIDEYYLNDRGEKHAPN